MLNLSGLPAKTFARCGFYPRGAFAFQSIQCRLQFAAVAVALVFVSAAAHSASGAAGADSNSTAGVETWFQEASRQSAPRYEYRKIHDPNGTGKFYMGREIAQVMGAGGISWLDRPERAEEEHPEAVIKAMELHSGDVVADLGAGSGYFTFRIAPEVGKTGKVLAVDIQEEMLEAIRSRAAAQGISNVREVKDTETDPELPADSVDRVLMVDVYHELAYPFEVMTKVHEALKPGGRVVFVEYRKEDPHVRIKEVHKMSVDQLTREMAAVGLARAQVIESLPAQHIVIFARSEEVQPSAPPGR
jgi:ubiquinone/menaquinone biosynthesis C-methylase UbiE